MSVIETTNVPCFPLKPETNAPCNPLYPRTTVHYNEKMKAIEVGFYGPEHGVLHILTLDRAKCLRDLLDSALRTRRIMGYVEAEVRHTADQVLVELAHEEYARPAREAEGA